MPEHFGSSDDVDQGGLLNALSLPAPGFSVKYFCAKRVLGSATVSVKRVFYVVDRAVLVRRYSVS